MAMPNPANSKQVYQIISEIALPQAGQPKTSSANGDFTACKVSKKNRSKTNCRLA
jgi:hypothetical protein